MGTKRNNMYIYTLTCSFKQVILHNRSCKYATHKYVYRIKAYHEWSEEPLVTIIVCKVTYNASYEKNNMS